MSHRPAAAGLVLVLVLPATAPAIGTPFGHRVHRSIQAASRYLLQQQAPTGEIGNTRRTGLALLCLLDRPVSADWGAPRVGYAGLSEEDQARVRLAVRALIEGDTALSDGVNPYTYGTGAGLMALSLYDSTGGPRDLPGGRIDVRTALQNGVLALRGTQGDNADCNAGGWNYNNPSRNGDLSATQFAMAGLSAAAATQDEAAAALERTPTFLETNQARAQNGGGGLVYQACSGHNPSQAMTASGLWCYRLAGVAPSDARVQAALAWLRDHYEYDRQSNWWQNSFYYYLWAAAKGLAASRDDGSLGPDGLSGDDVGGARDPALDGFPEEPAGWYYDFAWLLTEEQLPEGGWSRRRPNGSNGQDPISDAAFACLVLERSAGGVCLDPDDDGVCDARDVCPNAFDPHQLDRDEDGVGDACDSCPYVADRGQQDTDGDGLGDACDRYTCVPTGAEVCDGLDNDCNERIDEVPPDPEPCATGLPGACALGQRVCTGGQWVCVTFRSEERTETCDLVDNDCDGQVDEDLLNSCGLCHPYGPERCNGLDDDCDGDVDEEAPCPEGRTCVAGSCVRAAEDGACPSGFVDHAGWCVPACLAAPCPDGQLCEAPDGACFDPCEDVACAPGQRCRLGRCGSCDDVGCSTGERCVAGDCLADLCVDMACAANERCRDGLCVSTCAGLSCPLRHSCVDGVCVPDPCGGLDCEPCVCAEDPCLSMVCAPNERCDMVCPDGGCVARCVADWVTGQRPDVDPCHPASDLYDALRCLPPPTRPQRRVELAGPEPALEPFEAPAEGPWLMESSCGCRVGECASRHPLLGGVLRR